MIGRQKSSLRSHPRSHINVQSVCGCGLGGGGGASGAGIGITKDLFCISHIICVPACHKEPLPVLTVHSQGRDSAALFEQPFLSPAEFVLTLQFAL